MGLLHLELFDRTDLWVHPIVLGVGKKTFDGGQVPTNLALLEPPVASPTGTVLRYGLAHGIPGTGDMAEPDLAPSDRIRPLARLGCQDQNRFIATG